MIPLIQYLGEDDLIDALKAARVSIRPPPEILADVRMRCNDAVLHMLQGLDMASQSKRDEHLKYLQVTSKLSQKLLKNLTSVLPDKWSIDPDQSPHDQLLRLLSDSADLKLYSLLDAMAGADGDPSASCAEPELAALLVAIARLQQAAARAAAELKCGWAATARAIEAAPPTEAVDASANPPTQAGKAPRASASGSPTALLIQKDRHKNPLITGKRLRPQVLGMELINSYAILSKRKIGLSRHPSAGEVNGPLPRYLVMLFARIRASLEAYESARDLAAMDELSPSLGTLANWISLAKKTQNIHHR
jgi:hypothetical protein